jgi:hypothetical protein
MVAHSRQSDRLFSSRLNWDPPPLHPQSSESPLQASVLPPFGLGGGHTYLRVRGGGANSDEGTDTVVLSRYIYMYFVDGSIGSGVPAGVQ